MVLSQRPASRPHKRARWLPFVAEIAPNRGLWLLLVLAPLLDVSPITSSLHLPFELYLAAESFPVSLQSGQRCNVLAHRVLVSVPVLRLWSGYVSTLVECRLRSKVCLLWLALHL